MEIQRTKNVAGYISFPMVDKTNPETFKSGESVTDTAYYKDGAGAWTSLAITDTVSEIGSTGLYELDLTAGELNHDQIIIKLTAANSQDQAVLITTIPAPANMKEIDEQDTNGYNATLKLAQLDIQSQTAGQPAINLVGNTSGAGLKSKGGANAHGFELEGGSNFGHGLQATGTGSAGKGGRFVGSSSGGAAHGISLEAAGSGNGLHAVGGATDYTAGIHGESSATNGRGIELKGSGDAAGLYAEGGATGVGGRFRGGATSGNGITAEAGSGGAGDGNGFYAIGGTNKAGFKVVGDGTGYGLDAAGGDGDGSIGIFGTSLATNGDGMKVIGAGTGEGLLAQGGATSGAGIKAVGGAGGAHGIETAGVGGGAGMYATGDGSYPGIYAIGDGSGAGIQADGGATANGILGQGGATSGAGIAASAQAGNSHGLTAVGNGTGHGVNAISGAGATGNGINAQANSVNGRGIEALGSGNNAGIKAKGGATGAGINARGGDTSGDGLICQADTDGHGLNIAALGASKNGINIDSDAAEGINVTAAQNAVKLNPTWAGILVDGGTSGITLLPATGSAIYGVSGSSGGVAAVYFKGNTGTDDAGMLLEGDGSGDGLRAAGGVTGRDIYADEIGARFDIDGVTGAGILEVLKKFADDNDGADFDATTDSLNKIAVAVGGTPLTAQEVRDAMKLAPTGGAPAAGSVDKHLDDILEDTGTTIPAQISGLNNLSQAEAEAACDTAIANAQPIDANLTQIGGSATVDTIPIVTMFEAFISALQGDVVRVGNTYTYKKQDGTTTTFSYTVSTGGRT